MKRRLIPSLHWRRREAGSAAVEFAVVAMPVILLVLGTYDYFAASYQTANLVGAARAISELTRNNPSCVGNLTATKCLADISSLITTMASNNSGTNNTLSSLRCCIQGAPAVTTASPLQAAYAPQYLYSCAYRNVLSQSDPSPCNPPGCTTVCDTRVVQYVQVTVQKGLQQLFAWDPWSSANPLTATMVLRTQ